MPTTVLEPNANATRSVLVVWTPPPADTAEWFERCVLGILPDLMSAARRLTSNTADAEDLVAEAVAKAWLGLATLQDRGRFRGWIFRILTNEFLTQRRSRISRLEAEPLPDESGDFSLFEQLHQPFLLWWSSPEKDFLNKLLREDLVRAIDGVPETFRVVVILVDVYGLSYQEVADAVGVPVGTVRSRLARARSILQKTLWEHARDAGVRTQHKNPRAT